MGEPIAPSAERREEVAKLLRVTFEDIFHERQIGNAIQELCNNGLDYLDELAGVDPSPIPRSEWRCFHCGETFTDPDDAALHFGRTQMSLAACEIKAGEGGLVAEIRHLEEAIENAQRTDGDEDVRFAVIQSDHARALIREEQKGFERGIADARAEVEAMRERCAEWHRTQAVLCDNESDKEFHMGCAADIAALPIEGDGR